MDHFANVKEWASLLRRIFGDTSTVRIEFKNKFGQPNQGCWGVYLSGPRIGEAAIYREGATVTEAIMLALQTYLDGQDRMLSAAKRMLQEIALRN